MLVALLTDIHGNREALDACLADARRMGPARFVFLGDYVGYGADPSYVVDTVSGMVEEGAVALLGNHDEAIASPSENMNALACAAIDWTRGRLDAAQGAFLRTLPLFRQEGERPCSRGMGLRHRSHAGRAQHDEHRLPCDVLRPRARAGPVPDDTGPAGVAP